MCLLFVLYKAGSFEERERYIKRYRVGMRVREIKRYRVEVREKLSEGDLNSV